MNAERVSQQLPWQKAILSGKELAERWGVKIGVLSAAVEKGELNAIAGFGNGGHKKYAIAYIEEIERQGGFTPAHRDPLAFRRMEREVERLKAENKRLIKIVDSFLAGAIRMRQEIMEAEG